MVKLVSKANELGRNKWVANSADITETAGATTTTAVISGIAGMEHGDICTCIETHVEYLYNAVAGNWARPTA